ncbi:amidohydrolase family protein [Aquimarina rubra]|uniref:Amidohydrolase family protein n=1 Tax=Aquimarina rubra TaxID=1920033 RepID=A0ABW5LC86_9FLAO
MKKQCIVLLTLCALFLMNAKAQDLVIKNVNVIDVENGILKTSQDVLIKGKKIQKIVNSKPGKVYENAKVIDGTEKYLSPGFVNSHVHVALGPVGVEFEDKKPVLAIKLEKELPKITLELLLEYGITTARDPGGYTQSTVQAKKQIENGLLKGPELLVAGSILDTSRFKNLTATVHNTSQIREEIRAQYKAGVDLVKLYTSLTPEFLEAGIDEAHKLGLGTVAHLHSTSWTEAANLGIDNIVHIIPGNDSYIPESKREDYHNAEKMGTKAFFKWFELVDLDSKEIKEMIKALKSNDVSIDPTLIPFHAAFFGDQGLYQSNELLKRLPEPLVTNWKTVFNFNIGWTKDDFEIAHNVWPKVERFTRMLHEEGIMLTAGTDANNPWIVPGDSFHKELKLLKACGISNKDVLRIATINGAKLLNLENQIGSITIGKDADLVLLSKNPLEDISATSNLELIISNGEIIKPLLYK